MAKKLVAAKLVAIGTGKDDPEREGFQGVVIYKKGQAIDQRRTKLDDETAAALVANGYLTEE